MDWKENDCISIHSRAHTSASFPEVTIFRNKKVHRSKKHEVIIAIPFTLI
jgi:hypothetical protein